MPTNIVDRNRTYKWIDITANQGIFCASQRLDGLGSRRFGFSFGFYQY